MKWRNTSVTAPARKCARSATRVLELNANHKAFAALKDAYENDKDKAKQLSKILASLAELMAGVEIDDPAEFVAEVSELF